jgi:hypothetical protein
LHPGKRESTFVHNLPGPATLTSDFCELGSSTVPSNLRDPHVQPFVFGPQLYKPLSLSRPSPETRSIT